MTTFLDQLNIDVKLLLTSLTKIGAFVIIIPFSLLL